MKVYIVYFCVLLNCLCASATIQNSSSQDKPPRLYIQSYNLSYNANGSESDIWTIFDTLTIAGSVDYSDGSAGSASWDSFEDYESFIFFDDATWSWPQDYWNGTLIDINQTPHNIVTNIWSLGRPPVSTQNLNFNVSESFSYCPPPYNGTNYYVESQGANVQTIMKLQTGGRAASKLRNLFALTASATQCSPNADGIYDGAPYEDGYTYIDYFVTSGTNLPSQQITIGSYGALNTNGIKYLILPDGADVDVSPSVSGANNYNFNMNLAAKYHSYFDLYVYQPNPGYSIIPVNLTNYLEPGHVSWSFETEIPTNVLGTLNVPAGELSLLQLYTIAGGTMSTTLGIPCGFYPNTDTNYGFGIFAGSMQWPDPDIRYVDIMRRFYISLTGIQTGLNYTLDTSNNPPNYTLYLLQGSQGMNCVGAARNAGYNSGISSGSGFESIGNALPDEGIPQNFGVALVGYYPGPFITTNAYYPINSAY